MEGAHSVFESCWEEIWRRALGAQRLIELLELHNYGLTGGYDHLSGIDQDILPAFHDGLFER